MSLYGSVNIIQDVSDYKNYKAYIGSFKKYPRFLALKFLYFTKLIWHHLIEQSFSFQNLFYKLRYDF